ncbi:MAG: hypothetical protein GVY33_10680 [Alphaproteobacteria bacterium]|jgi:hypothetical protein|nr:hypothetical protein [Alphaproteobacteria bacterium]
MSVFGNVDPMSPPERPLGDDVATGDVVPTGEDGRDPAFGLCGDDELELCRDHVGFAGFGDDGLGGGSEPGRSDVSPAVELGVEVPSDLADLSESATWLAVEVFETGDVASGGPGSDTLLHDPLTDDVATPLDCRVAVDGIARTGAVDPCSVPPEDGTLVLYEGGGDDAGELIENAGIFFQFRRRRVDGPFGFAPVMAEDGVLI